MPVTRTPLFNLRKSRVLSRGYVPRPVYSPERSFLGAFVVAFCYNVCSQIWTRYKHIFLCKLLFSVAVPFNVSRAFFFRDRPNNTWNCAFESLK